ncbi:hypothetical protein TNCV_4687871 [Trichonephila clavipes]|nr:hypothetical protein TNCV_4687871 [Trichonephila clavipes]
MWPENGLPVMDLSSSGNVTRKVNQGSPRASKSAQDRYLPLTARRHRWTMAPRLTRDLAAGSGRSISRQTVYSHLSHLERFSLNVPGMSSLVSSFGYIQQKGPDIVELKT